MFDVKGRFTVHRISNEEAKVSVCTCLYMKSSSLPLSLSHTHSLTHTCTIRNASLSLTHTHTQYKLGKVKRVSLGKKGIPYCVTHDGRTIRYPDPQVAVNDTVQIDIETGKIKDFIKFDVGNVVMATGGRNLGRVGLITHRERHHGSFDIIHIKDALGHSFATRMTNVFVIGKGQKAIVSLPRQKGLRLTVAEERDRRLEAKQL